MKQRTWELQEQDEEVVASLEQGLGFLLSLPACCTTGGLRQSKRPRIS